ncbi:Protein FAM136A [Caligus rogercresseyi]|uniref:Protein FAM136A n=1 Tax=Caligus rogercresseyi TaxID=217165 RepID=A0A7T8KGV3_CALRO|nr:Protein FAM136A [Caligus rogercresseyi]
MSAEAQERVQSAIKDFVNGLDRSHIRGMDRSMHECAATCLSDTEASIDAVHACIAAARRRPSVLKVRSVRIGTVSKLPEPLYPLRQDEVKDKLSPSSSEAEITKFRSEFDTCAVNCCDKNIARLPNITKKVRDCLNTGSTEGRRSSKCSESDLPCFDSTKL